MTSKPHLRRVNGLWIVTVPNAARARRKSPGVALLADVRSGFVGQQKSLASWCRENQITPAWARQVLVGARKGPSAAKLRNRIATDAGVDTAKRAAR